MFFWDTLYFQEPSSNLYTPGGFVGIGALTSKIFRIKKTSENLTVYKWVGGSFVPPPQAPIPSIQIMIPLPDYNYKGLLYFSPT